MNILLQNSSKKVTKSVPFSTYHSILTWIPLIMFQNTEKQYQLLFRAPIKCNRVWGYNYGGLKRGCSEFLICSLPRCIRVLVNAKEDVTKYKNFNLLYIPGSCNYLLTHLRASPSRRQEGLSPATQWLI